MSQATTSKQAKARPLHRAPAAKSPTPGRPSEAPAPPKGPTRQPGRFGSAASRTAGAPFACRRAPVEQNRLRANLRPK